MGYSYKQVIERFEMGFYKVDKVDGFTTMYLVEMSDGSFVGYSKDNRVYKTEGIEEEFKELVPDFSCSGDVFRRK